MRGRMSRPLITKLLIPTVTAYGSSAETPIQGEICGTDTDVLLAEDEASIHLASRKLTEVPVP